MKSLIIIILLQFLLFTTNGLAQPANDDPCGAIQIPVFTDVLGRDCTPTNNYSWNGATLTAAISDPSCVIAGTPKLTDVWYKLVVPTSGKFRISINSADGLYVAVYGPSNCTSTISFSALSCLAYPGGNVPGTLTTTFLTPGSTVYLRILSTRLPTNPAGISILLCASEVLPAIDNTQKVGIGTNNPLAKLDVAGTAIVRDSLLVTKNIETLANLKSNSLQVTGGADVSGSMGIGTTSPATSAKLEISSTTQGFLPPRMDSTQRNAIASPATGLTIYNTTLKSVQVYNGTAWVSTVHFIGERYGGGIVFYVYDNGQHGLIAATADQSTGIRWRGGTYTNTRARANGVGAGLKNTAIIIANQGPVDGNAFAATLCNEYSVTVAGVTYGDWYLPSIHELNLLYVQKAVVGGISGTLYWSSSEYEYDNGGTAWYQNFSYGNQDVEDKNFPFSVRAVRAF